MIRRGQRYQPGVNSPDGNVETIAREVDRLMPPRSSSGLYADRPTDPKDGQVYYPEDGGYQCVFLNGVWRPLPAGILCKYPPLASKWSQFGSPAVFTDLKGVIRMSLQTGSGTDTRRGGLVAFNVGVVSAVAEFGMNMIPLSNSVGTEDFGIGIVLYESATTKTFGMEYYVKASTTSVTPFIRAGYSTTLSGAGWTTSSVTATTNPVGGLQTFFRFAIIGGKIYPQWSIDKLGWRTAPFGGSFDGVLVTTAFTTAPDQVGIYAFNGSTNLGADVSCFHFDQYGPYRG